MSERSLTIEPRSVSALPTLSLKSLLNSLMVLREVSKFSVITWNALSRDLSTPVKCAECATQRSSSDFNEVSVDSLVAVSCTPRSVVVALMFTVACWIASAAEASFESVCANMRA